MTEDDYAMRLGDGWKGARTPVDMEEGTVDASRCEREREPVGDTRLRRVTWSRWSAKPIAPDQLHRSSMLYHSSVELYRVTRTGTHCTLRIPGRCIVTDGEEAKRCTGICLGRPDLASTCPAAVAVSCRPRPLVQGIGSRG